MERVNYMRKNSTEQKKMGETYDTIKISVNVISNMIYKKNLLKNLIIIHDIGDILDG